jgi:hypothetical protein
MRYIKRLVMFIAVVVSTATAAQAQDGPKLHELNGFMAKGGKAALVPELLKQRLSLAEIEKSHLNGEATDVKDILGLLAKFEKLTMRVDEPAEVRGNVPVFLPPNTMGDEAYTTCFSALTYNGLVLAAANNDLELVRPEKRPTLPRAKRPWNRNDVLSTWLIRLGYLKPDPIMRAYRDKIGTNVGHAIVELKSNNLIVVDRPRALEALFRYVDSQILEAMGVPASEGPAQADGLRPPSLGAIASGEAIHFYLMAFARSNEVRLVASQQRGSFDRYYPEADVWTSERGYRTLEAEYQRIGEFVRAARETRGEGWIDLSPGRTFTPNEQKRLEIRFGVVNRGGGRATTQKTKKAAKSAKKR